MSQNSDIFRLDFSRLSVLVVDDNSHMRRIIRMILTAYGIRTVFEAEDGAEALESFNTNVQDLVLSDWIMPIFDGVELTRMIRDQSGSPNPYVPIIMITGHSEKRRVTEARDAGVTEFLCKPISAKTLYLRIANCIVSPRPFIKTHSYFGPDRRRFQGNHYTGSERRSENNDKAEVIQVAIPGAPV